MTLELQAIHPFDVVPGRTYVTVRAGVRWANNPPGSALNLILQNPDDRTRQVTVGQGLIVNTMTMRFDQIPARVIQDEHERTSQKYDGLLASMRRAYGDQFDESETVTIVRYRVTCIDHDLQEKFLNGVVCCDDNCDAEALPPCNVCGPAVTPATDACNEPQDACCAEVEPCDCPPDRCLDEEAEEDLFAELEELGKRVAFGDGYATGQRDTFAMILGAIYP